MLEEKSKVLRWVVGKVPFLWGIESFRTELFSCWKRTFRACKSVETVVSILSELLNLDNHLKTENFSDSKDILCNQLEWFVGKLDEIYAWWIQMIKREDCARDFVEVGNSKIYNRDLIKRYGHSKDCGIQTSLVSSILAGDMETKRTVTDTGNGAIEIIEEYLEITSKHSANERRKYLQKFRLCLNCQRSGKRSKDFKSRTCIAPNCWRRQKTFAEWLLKEGGYKRCSRWHNSCSNKYHTREDWLWCSYN